MSSEILKEFLVAIGFAADERSAKKAEERVDRLERTITTSDKRTTKAQLREALIRGTTHAKTFDERVQAAEKLEAIDKRFGGLALRRTLRQAAKNAETNGDRIKWLSRLQKAEEDHRHRTAAGLQRVAGAAVAAAVLVQGATLAITGFAQRAAEKLEALAYSSDRTKSSVQDLKTFSAAVSQLGGTAGGALNDLEAFAGRLRQNPQGYTAFLKSVGVEARDAKGNIRGAAELYKEFRTEVGKKPYEQQLLYANEMGVSEQTWRATDPAKLAEQEAKARARYARMNHDPDAAAQDAVKLQNTFRDMWETIGVVGEKTLSKVFADVGDNVKGFTTFLEQHGEQIADILSKVAQVVLAVSRALLELATSDKVKGFLDWILGAFGKVDDGTGKWVANTEKIKEALEALAIFIATVFVAKITGAFRDILKEFKPLLALLAPFLGAIGLPALGAAAATGALVAGSDPSKGITHGGRPDGALNPGDELQGAGPGTPAPPGAEGPGSRLGRAWGGVKRFLGIGGASAAEGGGAASGAGAGRPLGRMARNENAAAIMDELRQGGYNNNAIAATIGSMQTESSFNPRARNNVSGGHTGLWQWDSTRWPKIAGWIKGQGGDPYDVRWQAKAWMAEHNAKKGDPLYDTGRTAEGGRILRSNPTLEDAIHGVRESERFGAGEEGGRAANARKWLPEVEKPPAAPVPPAAAPSAPPLILKPEGMPDAPGVTMREHLANQAREAAQRIKEAGAGLDKDKLRSFGNATQNFDPKSFFTVPPAGTQNTTSNQTSSNSFTGGPTHITLNNHGSPAEGAEILKRHKDRQMADETRYAANVFA